MARILVVDDEPDVRELFNITLKMAGHETDTVKHGLEAIEKLATDTPDLIVLDLMMPHMDGFTFLSHVRTEMPTKPMRVLVATAKVLEDVDQERLGDWPVVGILNKGELDIGQMVMVVSTALSKSPLKEGAVAAPAPASAATPAPAAAPASAPVSQKAAAEVTPPAPPAPVKPFTPTPSPAASSPSVPSPAKPTTGIPTPVPQPTFGPRILPDTPAGPAAPPAKPAVSEPEAKPATAPATEPAKAAAGSTDSAPSKPAEKVESAAAPSQPKEEEPANKPVPPTIAP